MLLFTKVKDGTTVRRWQELVGRVNGCDQTFPRDTHSQDYCQNEDQAHSVRNGRGEIIVYHDGCRQVARIKKGEKREIKEETRCA